MMIEWHSIELECDCPGCVDLLDGRESRTVSDVDEKGAMQKAKDLGWTFSRRSHKCFAPGHAPKKSHRRKLDTPGEIEAVCYRYYLTPAKVSQIARSMKVSCGVVDRVIKENGAEYVEANSEAIDRFRQRRTT